MASGCQGQDENQIRGPSLSVLLPLLPHPQLGPEENRMVGRGHPQSTPPPSSELMSSEKSGAGRRRRGPEPLWDRELSDPYEAHGGPAKLQVLI